MATEEITILKLNAEDGVKTLQDLKNNIKALKGELDTLEVGSKEYANTLLELQDNQAALKNAMHATTAEEGDQADSFAVTARAAQGLSTSYNSLVRQMAKLDEAFRSTENAAERADLGRQIKAINKELKDLDAQRGKFGRNVGDYFNQLVPGLKKTSDALGLIGKQPVMSLVMLLAPVLTKIVSALKENGTALGAVKRGMEALQPVFNFFEKILDKIAGWFSQIVDWLLEFTGQHKEAFKTFVAGAVGVGNAIKEFLLIPVRNTIEAVKGLGNVIKDVFTGQWKKIKDDAGAAIKGIGDSIKKGFDFKGNFELGKQAGEAFIAGLGSTKKKAQDTAKGIKEAVVREFTDLTIQVDKLALQTIATSNKTTGIITRNLDEIMAKNREAYEQEKALQAARIEAAFGYAAAMSNVLGSLADMYEQNGDADERAAKKAKELRTASAIISTISGAISAYMNTIESIKFPAVAIPLAIVNAATVLAAGMAQIKQINAVKVGSSTGAASSAVVSSPAASFSPSVVQTQTITGLTEQERLNAMAAKNRVYILASDLQAERNAERVRVAETAF